MKKYKIIIFMLLVLIIVGIVFFIKKASYKNRIEADFGFNEKNIILEKKSEREEWSPNGDGLKIIILKYKGLSNIKSLNKFPIKEELQPNEIPKEFLSNPNGYYKCIIDKEDNRNFKILIVNPDIKEICVYYQIM